jgi:hypothetical protein
MKRMDASSCRFLPLGEVPDSLELGRRLIWLGALLGVMILLSVLVLWLAPLPSVAPSDPMLYALYVETGKLS